MVFRMHSSGLHYYDPRNEELAFVSTVSENKLNFTKRQIKRASVARTLCTTLSYPSWKDFKYIIRSNLIKDCPVTVEDVEISEEIWGKDVPALKGKTTRKKPAPVARNNIKIPLKLLNLHKEVYLTADVFFVNGIAFLLTLS